MLERWGGGRGRKEGGRERRTGLTYRWPSHSYSVAVSGPCDVAYTVMACTLLLYFFSPGDLLLRSAELNSQICSTLSGHSARLTSPADKSNPFGLYDYLLVYHPEEHTATMELLAAVEKG